MKKITEILIDKYAHKLGPEAVDILRMCEGFTPYTKKHDLSDIAVRHEKPLVEVEIAEQEARQLITNLIIDDL